MKIISYWSKLLSDLNMYHFAESENKCFIKKTFCVWCLCVKFLYFFHIFRSIWKYGLFTNFDFTFHVKNFLHFLCISGINFLVHWTKKSFFMFYWIFCLLLFLNCLKMSTNKSGTIFFVYNKYFWVNLSWVERQSGNE